VNNCKHLKSRVLREWPRSCQLHLPARGSLAFRYRGTRSSSGRKVSLERSWMRTGMSCSACQCTSMPCHGTDGSTSVANVPIRDTHVHVCIANIGTETFFENRAHSNSGYLAACVTELVCLQAGIAVQRLVSKQVVGEADLLSSPGKRLILTITMVHGVRKAKLGVCSP
jgi:hypothetical protein